MDYVILTGGKQYLVSPGQELKIEKLPAAVGEQVVFDKVLMTIDGAEVKIGDPYLKDISLTAEVLSQAKDSKKVVFRYHSKTRYRKTKGHRQSFTKVVTK